MQSHEEHHHLKRKADEMVSEAQEKGLGKRTRTSSKVRILVLFYSTGGNTYELAKIIADGVRLEGAEVDLRRIPETMSDEALKKWGVSKEAIEEKFKDIPVIDTKEFGTYDGYFFGSPTYSCTIAPQFAYFFSNLGEYWITAALEGRPFSVFSSVSEQQGGAETAKLDLLIAVSNLGMVFVGFPLSFKGISRTTIVHGVSKLGVSTISGGKKDDKKPSEIEENAARYAGQHLTKIATRLVLGELAEQNKGEEK